MILLADVIFIVKLGVMANKHTTYKGRVLFVS